MRPIRFALGVLAIGLFAATASSADPPQNVQVTRIWIGKNAHELKLYAGDQVVRSYRVAIGPGGPGPKWREGDMVTPVGHYHVTMHQPSQFKIFLRLDYPTAADRVRFADLKAKGSLPENATIGGDIGIHGTGNPAWTGVHKLRDWTLGCVALDNDEIVEIAGLVKDGTPVDIED